MSNLHWMHFRLALDDTIYLADFFQFQPGHCFGFKTIRHKKTNLNRIEANKSHRVIVALRRISCHSRNYSQPYFFKRNQSSDNRSHGFGAKFLFKKLSASDFSYERKSASSRSMAMVWKHTKSYCCMFFIIFLCRHVHSPPFKAHGKTKFE